MMCLCFYFDTRSYHTEGNLIQLMFLWDALHRAGVWVYFTNIILFRALLF